MQPPDRAAPFDSAQAAWFAVARTMNTNPIGTDRQVEGVVRCLDRLYRNRRIELLHARILRIWGPPWYRARTQHGPTSAATGRFGARRSSAWTAPCARSASWANSARARPAASVQPIPAGTPDKASAPGHESGDDAGAGRVDQDQVGPLAIGDLAPIVQPGRRRRIGRNQGPSLA